jgi:single-strand DNA-binding protein
MAGVNKTLTIGRLGKDPTIKMTPNGKKVAEFSLATSEKYQGEEKTTWHNMVAFGKTADIIEQYVKKGNQLYVEGKLDVQSWDDQQTGQKRYKTQIIVLNLTMLGGGQNSPSSNSAPPASNPNYNADSVPDMPIDDIPF